MKKLLTLILSTTSILALADNTVASPASTTAPATTTTTTVMGAPTAPANDATNKSGLYFGAGVGMGWNNQASPAATFRLDGGYNFDQFWAIEAGTTGLTQSGGAYNQNLQIYDLSVKGTLPAGDMFDVFAQVGGAYSAPGVISGSIPNNPNIDGAHQSSWSFMSGVGVDMNFTKNVAINLSDLYYYGQSAGIQGNTNVLLLGFKYAM